MAAGLALMSLQLREELLHPLQPSCDLLRRSRIRQPNVLTRPKCFSWHGNHVRLAQEPARHIRRRLDAALTKECAYIWIRIERALRIYAGHAVDLAQSVHDLI